MNLRQQILQIRHLLPTNPKSAYFQVERQQRTLAGKGTQQARRLANQINAQLSFLADYLIILFLLLNLLIFILFLPLIYPSSYFPFPYLPFLLFALPLIFPSSSPFFSVLSSFMFLRPVTCSSLLPGSFPRRFLATSVRLVEERHSQIMLHDLAPVPDSMSKVDSIN
jgi:hypothetical protein